MMIGRDWEDRSGSLVKEIEMWVVAPPADGFASNVNVFTQVTDLESVEDYLSFSEDHLGGMKLIDSQLVENPDGKALGLMEYSGIAPGSSAPLHFLATMAVSDGRAVVATFTAPPTDFDSLRPGIDPYLRSLRPL